MTAPNGKIYVIGGCGPGKCVPNRVEAYNASTNTWACSAGDPSSRCSSRRIAPLPTPRVGMGAAVGRDGKIYVIGASVATVGRSLIGPVATVEAYNLTTNTWACSVGDTAAGCSSRKIAPLPTARGNLAAVQGPDGKIYAIGGDDPNSHRPLHKVEAYDPSTNTWRTLARLPTARGGLAAATGRDGRMYAIGGDYRKTVEAYNPATNAWSGVAPLHTRRSGLGAATGGDGHLYVMGGISVVGRVAHPVFWGPAKMVEAYTPAG